MKVTFHFTSKEASQKSTISIYYKILEGLLKMQKDAPCINIFTGYTALYESITKFSSPCKTLEYLYSVKTGWDRITDIGSFMSNVIHAVTVTSISLDVAKKMHDILLSEECYIGANETTPEIEMQWKFLIENDFTPKFNIQGKDLYILIDPEIMDNRDYIDTLNNALKDLPCKKIKTAYFNPKWKEIPRDSLNICLQEKECPS